VDGEGIADPSDGLTIQGGKTRGGCTDDLKNLLTGEWQESAGIRGKLLAIGYGLATVSRAASQLVFDQRVATGPAGAADFLEGKPSRARESSC
jgi:hypothetical protein